MRLRNITRSVKDQNWFAVFLDFFIVVLGVFIGIQLGNWNEGRQLRGAYSEAEVRFLTENDANIEMTDRFLVGVEERLELARKAIVALRACDRGGEARQDIETGINVIRGTGFLKIRTTALTGLTKNDAYLSLMAEENREALKEFERQVSQTQKTLDWLEEQPFRNHIETKPQIDFGELLAPEEMNGAKIRILYLKGTLEESCQNEDLLGAFYLWERSATFQILRARQINEAFREYSK